LRESKAAQRAMSSSLRRSRSWRSRSICAVTSTADTVLIAGVLQVFEKAESIGRRDGEPFGVCDAHSSEPAVSHKLGLRHVEGGESEGENVTALGVSGIVLPETCLRVDALADLNVAWVGRVGDTVDVPGS
jgi:hypothetical protein